MYVCQDGLVLSPLSLPLSLFLSLYLSLSLHPSSHPPSISLSPPLSLFSLSLSLFSLYLSLHLSPLFSLMVPLLLTHKETQTTDTLSTHRSKMDARVTVTINIIADKHDPTLNKVLRPCHTGLSLLSYTYK